MATPSRPTWPADPAATVIGQTLAYLARGCAGWHMPNDATREPAQPLRRRPAEQQHSTARCWWPAPRCSSTTRFAWHDTALYRSPKGQFFVAGEGGAMSMWSEPVGNNGRGGGSGIRLVDDLSLIHI